MLGFVILGTMLFMSGVVSIYEISRLGGSLKGLIADNYRSIGYSKAMLSALEDQNTALLGFVGAGNDNWRDEFERADKVFSLYLDSAQKTLTLESERLYIDSVAHHYSIFVRLALGAFSSGSLDLESYLAHLHHPLHEALRHVQGLMTLNQKALYESTVYLEGTVKRANMPGLVVIFTSLLFTFLFTYLIHHYFVSPIIRLTKGINDYVRFQKPLDVPIETRDEIFTLKEAIVKLISICRFTKKE